MKTPNSKQDQEFHSKLCQFLWNERKEKFTLWMEASALHTKLINLLINNPDNERLMAASQKAWKRLDRRYYAYRTVRNVLDRMN